MTIVYHKTEAEISSFPSEYEAAVKEGVQFNFLKQPIAYLNKKQMRALNNIRRKPAESDETDLAGLLVQNITKTDDGQFVTEGGQEVIPVIVLSWLSDSDLQPVSFLLPKVSRSTTVVLLLPVNALTV